MANPFEEIANNFQDQNQFGSETDYCNPDEFTKLVHARRSVRKFTKEQIPDEIVEKCLDLALLAPNSSNLQTWEFYWVKNPEKKKLVGEACFSQPAATTADTLIVCVARPDLWRENCKLMLKTFDESGVSVPKTARDYYAKLLPLVYTFGPLNILSPLKWIMNNSIGLFRPMVRSPLTSFGFETVVAKSCALACENLMLAFRAYGYDTCPMEGYDSVRLAKAIDLPGGAEFVMVIGAGRRDVGGIYGPRLRFDRRRFVKKIN